MVEQKVWSKLISKVWFEGEVLDVKLGTRIEKDAIDK